MSDKFKHNDTRKNSKQAFFPIRLSVLLPAYNEAENLEQLVIESLSVLDEIIQCYELIIINDGSSDNTLETALSLSANNNHVKVVNHEKNNGMGHAIKQGCAAAQYEWLLYIDADNQIKLKTIKNCFPMLEHADMVIGYRINRKDTRWRRSISHLYNKFISLFINLPIRDINCGFKLFHKDILKNISLPSRGFFLSTELALKAHSQGIQIKEFPIEHFPRLRGKSSVSFHSIILALKDILLYSFDIIKTKAGRL